MPWRTNAWVCGGAGLSTLARLGEFLAQAEDLFAKVRKLST